MQAGYIRAEIRKALSAGELVIIYFMGEQTILEKLKSVAYKLFLPAFLWSIGFKTISEYIDALEKDFKRSDTIRVFPTEIIKVITSPERITYYVEVPDDLYNDALQEKKGCQNLETYEYMHKIGRLPRHDEIIKFIEVSIGQKINPYGIERIHILKMKS